MKTFLISLSFFFSLSRAYSTHLKAGEITAARISPNAFKFTLTIYLDSLALVANSSLDEPEAIFSVNGIAVIPAVTRDSMISVGNGTWKNTYHLIYSLSPGIYTVSYTENYRNKNILNINGGTDTDNVPFYIETKVNFDPFMGLNKSPVLLLPPIDVAVAGQKYIHNPAAFDFEGDSISYQLIQPKQSGNTNVPKFVNPNLVTNSGTFTLDPVTGDMVWNTPLKTGLYNVAFLITEWRNGEKLTIIERDMQIKVVSSTNRPPVLGASLDTCIVAGTSFTKTISATDPDGNTINLISTNSPAAGVYAISPSPATFNLTNPNPQLNPTAIFSWNTTCAHIRAEPYQIEFKATDVPSAQPPLSDLQYLRITIVGPSPTGFSVAAVSGGLNLNWNRYDSSTCNTANKMQIFRRECDSTALALSPCQTGVPASSGFVKIAEVPISQLSYKDTVNLKYGNKYCYVIAASFPAPSNGESLPSAMDCGTLLLDQPVLLNVSVDSTSILNGRITVRWTKPQILPSPGSYEYIVLKASGIIEKNYIPIDTITDINQTSIVDSTINTADSSYNYIVKFYYNNGLTLKGTTDPLSSVRLTSKPGSGKIFLNWDVSGQLDYSYFRIYKYEGGVPVLIDSIAATGKSGSYIATGIPNKETACFFVETVGRYCDLTLPMLLNRSEKVCETPRDSTPPCPPTLFIKPIYCDSTKVFENDLHWTNNPSAGCNHDIKGYNLYYAQYEGDDPVFIKFIPSDTFYVDVDSLSLSGCYEVTVINYYGVESARSNRVCMDNCSFYKLPDLITPNGDLLNDSFRPFPVPRNVEEVNFFVYNRWGKLVYHSDNDINLNWRGVSGNGNPLADGIYYFQADVKFYHRLRREDENLKLKGWVEIINSNESSGR
jgi:gliding motility-associated-like protein